jgi:hypothetical protein
MTFDQRVEAVAEFGVTASQARFLVTVMLHGGVCVPRQYARFVGTAYGRRVNAFFDKLVEARHAVGCRCVHNRARVYHVRYEPLYRAIGEPHSRNRRPVPAARVAERLMVLDAVISHPDLLWLATAHDKVAFCTVAAPSCPTEQLPHRIIRAGARRQVRLFPDALPIGVDSAGRVTFVFLATSSIADDLRAYLQRHGELLRALPCWTIRLLLPSYVAPVSSSFENVVRDELATPLSAETFDELRWYFDRCRLAAATRTKVSDARFRRTERAFAGTRFRLLYRRWLADGDAALEVVTSPAIRDSLARGAGRIECAVLPLSYGHLSPLASLVRPGAAGVEEGEETPEEGLARPQPPDVDTNDDDPAGCARDWQRLVNAHRGQSSQ